MNRLAGTLVAFLLSFLISCFAGAILVVVAPGLGAVGHPLAQGIFLAVMLYGPLGYAIVYLGVALAMRGTWNGPVAYAASYLMLGAIALALIQSIQNLAAFAILLIAAGAQLLLQRAIALIIRPKSGSAAR